jgi:hypothetical protein
MLRLGFTANPWGFVASEWATTIKGLTDEDWAAVMEHASAHMPVGGIDSDDEDANLEDEEDEGVSSERMSLPPRTMIQRD